MHTRVPVRLVSSFVLVSCLLLCTLCSPATPATPSSARADSLSQRWSGAMRDLHVPGMVVLVVNRDGGVRRDLLGVRDVERSRPIDPDTRLYIASCTKT